MTQGSYSLKQRLVIVLLVFIAAIWSGIVVYSYLDIRHEAEELLDAHLAQSAALILAQAGHDLEEIEVEHAPQFKEGSRVAFQLWERGEKLRLHSSNAPNTRLSTVTTGFSDSLVEGKEWRVFSAWTRNHENLVQVAERIEARHDITHTLTLNLLLPLLIALPLLGLLVWIAVAQALNPLARLGNEVARREAANLEPLQPQGAPLEIMPLIDNLNTLFARVARLIEHERRFTADAAHELRTPLAALMMQAQVARAATGDVERNHALDNVIAGCGRAARIVDQMLTLARLEPDDAVGHRQMFDLRALAQSVIADIAPSALQRNLDIELEDGDETPVAGNNDLIRIALRNLVDNAIRYSPDGSRIEVSVSAVDGSAHVRIIDQGPGISAEDHKKVGQRFYRVPGNAAAGSGLGLSITRRIADLHGGALELRPNPVSRGLTAELRLPLPSAAS
jgi:two-component system sensor histidine kinase QseC